MKAIKSHTDLQHSKQLAEILPLESADCFWDYDDLQKCHRITWFEDGYDKDSQLRLNKNNVCAWSLVALLNYLRGINFFPNIEADEDSVTMSIDYFEDEDAMLLTPMHNITTKAETFIDACYELILKLNELKIL